MRDDTGENYSKAHRQERRMQRNVTRRAFLMQALRASAVAWGVTGLPRIVQAEFITILLVGSILSAGGSVVLGFLKTVARRKEARYTAQAYEDQVQAEHAVNRGILEGIVALGEEMASLRRQIEHIDRSLDQRIRDNVEWVLLRKDDIDANIRAIARYKHFTEMRQAMLEQPESWGNEAALAYHRNGVERLRHEFVSERHILQERWNLKGETGPRIALMVFALMVELELDEELDGLNAPVNSAPAMRNYLAWFDAQHVEAHIRTLEDRVSKLRASWTQARAITPVKVWRDTRFWSTIDLYDEPSTYGPGRVKYGEEVVPGRIVTEGDRYINANDRTINHWLTWGDCYSPFNEKNSAFVWDVDQFEVTKYLETREKNALNLAIVNHGRLVNRGCMDMGPVPVPKAVRREDQVPGTTLMWHEGDAVGKLRHEHNLMVEQLAERRVVAEGIMIARGLAESVLAMESIGRRV